LARAYPEAATWVGTLCEVMLGLLDVAEGTAARGEVALRRALDAADRHDARQTAQAALAELYLLRGDPPAALAALEMDPDARVTICEDEGDVSLRTVPWRAWAMLLSGQREAAWEQAAVIVAVTREHEFKLLLADALRVQGVVAAHLRRWEDAQRALDEAVALSRAIGAPYAEAKALYAYGRLYLALDDVARARECLMAAIAICDRLGERLYAEQIESALAEVRAAVRAS